MLTYKAASLWWFDQIRACHHLTSLKSANLVLLAWKLGRPCWGRRYIFRQLLFIDATNIWMGTKSDIVTLKATFASSAEDFYKGLYPSALQMKRSQIFMNPSPGRKNVKVVRYHWRWDRWICFSLGFVEYWSTLLHPWVKRYTIQDWWGYQLDAQCSTGPERSWRYGFRVYCHTHRILVTPHSRKTGRNAFSRNRRTHTAYA